MCDREVRVGVIGAGSIGRAHLAAWQKAGARIVGVADPVEEAARAAAEAYDDCRTFPDAAALVSSGEVDLVSVCTPPATHERLVLTALEAGPGVLCEKPLAHDLASAERIEAAVTATGGFLAIGFCHRFAPQVEALKRLVDGGTLGTVRTWRNRFAGLHPTAAHTWFGDPSQAGGGSMTDTSVHSIDLFRFLIGEPTSVSALVSTCATDLGPALAVEDTSALLVSTDTGVLGVIESSWRTPIGASRIEVFGTKGTATLDYDSMELWVRTVDDPTARQVPVQDGDRFVRQAEHIMDAWRRGVAPFAGVADGLAATRILDAAYRAARHGGAPVVPVS